MNLKINELTIFGSQLLLDILIVGYGVAEVELNGRRA